MGHDALWWLAQLPLTTRTEMSRKRIIESDSDDDIIQEQTDNAGEAAPEAAAIDPTANAGVVAPVAAAIDVVQIEESSDDMWVRPVASAAVFTPPAVNRTPSVRRQLQTSASTSRAPSRPIQTPASTSRAPSAKRLQIAPSPQRPHRRARRFEEEAEESEDQPTSSGCSESSEDAQALYRRAVLGVRNARNGRQQKRTETVACPVCGKFAAFLENFI